MKKLESEKFYYPKYQRPSSSYFHIAVSLAIRLLNIPLFEIPLLHIPRCSRPGILVSAIVKIA